MCPRSRWSRTRLRGRLRHSTTTRSPPSRSSVRTGRRSRRSIARTHATFRVVLYVPHVGAYDRAIRSARSARRSPTIPRALARELRLQVGDVLIGVARRIRPALEQARGSRPRENGRARRCCTPSSSTPSSSIVRLVGRHRARREAADVGVMRAARDDVAQARAARPNTGVTTVMSGKCVPPLYGVFSMIRPRPARARRESRKIALHAVAHRAQVHGHVRSVRDQTAAAHRTPRRRSRAAL